ncbi:ribbon-helix-helix domain-containing protein [Streptomyces sp. NPDC001774]
MTERNLGGRPVVGPKVEFRLPAALLARVDERAEREGVNRSEMFRRLLTEALDRDSE